MSRTTVKTYSGKSLDLCKPDPAAICIEDIAHHLAQINRYNGACPYPFSVAQHSLLVARILPYNLKLYGLLHDASEAYIGDLVSPAKRIPALGQVFKPLEHRVQSAIYMRFGLDPNADYTEIKAADDAVQALEMGRLNRWPDLVELDQLPDPAHVSIEERPWLEVRQEFLTMYSILTLDFAA